MKYAALYHHAPSNVPSHMVPAPELTSRDWSESMNRGTAPPGSVHWNPGGGGGGLGDGGEGGGGGRGGTGEGGGGGYGDGGGGSGEGGCGDGDGGIGGGIGGLGGLGGLGGGVGGRYAKLVTAALVVHTRELQGTLQANEYVKKPPQLVTVTGMLHAHAPPEAEKQMVLACGLAASDGWALLRYPCACVPHVPADGWASGMA